MRRLLIRPGGIGDCLTSLPVMEQLRADYTEVWTPSAIVPLIQFADRVRSIAETGLDLLGLDESQPPLTLCRALAQFDSIVSWYGANRPEFRAAAERIHAGWRFLPALPPADSPLHATDFHALNAGAAMGLIPRLRVQAVERRESVVIHPFSGGLRKNWPLERFRLLAEELPGLVEWTAGPEEELPGAHRFDDLAALANWMGGARLYVGNDSGITHLAAAIGIPTVALFGASNSRVWRPRGENVAVVEAPSMEEIQAEDVLRAARRLAGTA